MLDRLSRMEANQLFCGRFRKADATRTGLAFEYKIESGSLTSQVQATESFRIINS
jgi:hypothetical protein